MGHFLFGGPKLYQVPGNRLGCTYSSTDNTSMFISTNSVISPLLRARLICQLGNERHTYSPGKWLYSCAPLYECY